MQDDFAGFRSGGTAHERRRSSRATRPSRGYIRPSGAVRRRIVAIEGNDHDAEGEPRPETTAGLQEFLDSQNPRIAHLQEQFVAELDRNVDHLRANLWRD